MPTATTTHQITRAHTATHLTNAMLGAIVELLTRLGLSAKTLLDDWHQWYDPALRAWIEEGSLASVIVECHRPSGRVEPVFEFPIVYASDGSVGLSHRHVALARQWVKLTAVPAGTSFKIICQYSGPHTPQPGWGPGQRASTAGLRSVTLGTLAAGPHASASLRYYTR
jgi:hypothetical protein